MKALGLDSHPGRAVLGVGGDGEVLVWVWRGMAAQSVLSQSRRCTHTSTTAHTSVSMLDPCHVLWDRGVSLYHVLELAEITLACRGLG